IDLSALKCRKGANLKLERAILSLGTLGGGNHFIEGNKDEEGNIYIVVHSGSRHLGLEVATYYQKLAYETLKGNEDIPKELAYLTGQLMEDYIHDMKLIQKFAVLNRKAMMD